MATLKRLRIIDHGFEHSQYFQGHGVSFTKYTHCATGAGQSRSEALDDALELLAQGEATDSAAIGILDHDERFREAVADTFGHTLTGLEALAESDYEDMHEDCPKDESEHEGCELYYHVSIDLEIS